MPPGGVTVAADARRVMPADGLIVSICPTDYSSPYCQPPLLGHTLAEDLLFRTDDRLLLGDGSLDPDGNPRLRVFRFVPSQPLVVGDTYELALRDVDGHIASTRSSVVIVDAATTPPPLPVVTELSYLQTFGFSRAIRLAFFRFEQVSGLLVADVGEPDEDPWQNISLRFTEQSDQGFYFRLGIDECHANLWQADLGVETKVRFGQLDAAGRFSGWTASYQVSYPDMDNEGAPIPGTLVALNAGTGEPEVSESSFSDVPEDVPNGDVEVVAEGARAKGGCSLDADGTAGGSTPWLLVLSALYASRRLSSAAKGSTSSRSKRSSVAGEPG